jgi:mono/diheme cytochrome c family protein
MAMAATGAQVRERIAVKIAHHGWCYDRVMPRACAFALLMMVSRVAGAEALPPRAAVAPAPPPKTAALLDQGRASFALNCAACHGATGEGNGPVAFAVRPRPRNLRKDPFVQGDRIEQLFATITRGLPSGTMASYAQLSDGERWALAYYVAAWRPAARR